MKFPFIVTKNCINGKITVTVTVNEIVKDHIVFQYIINTPTRTEQYTEMIDAKSAINNWGLEQTIQHLVDSLLRTIAEDECQTKLTDILKLDAKEVVFTHKQGEDPKLIITTKQGETIEIALSELSGKEQHRLMTILTKFFNQKVICEPEDSEYCGKMTIIFKPKNKSI